jgi:1,4-dihydroxy-2-naphthoate octaprenyltransferase
MRYSFPRSALCGRPVTDLGELMTTDSYRAAMRPLMLTVAWFAFLAGTAFAWAAIESQPPAPQSAKPAVFVLK